MGRPIWKKSGGKKEAVPSRSQAADRATACTRGISYIPLSSSRPTAYRMQVLFIVDLPSLVTPLWKYPDKHTQKCTLLIS
jgi:hypothetical protein